MRCSTLPFLSPSCPFPLPPPLPIDSFFFFASAAPRQKKAKTATDWTDKENLAKALESKIIGKVNFPLRINIFVVGLDGSGHLGLTLPHGLVHGWLEHLETTTPHSLVDRWKSPTAQSHGSGSRGEAATNARLQQSTAKARAEDFAAAIGYTFDYRLIETSPLVTQVVERVLHAHHRIVEAHEIPTDTQVPGGKKPGLSKMTTTNHFQVDGNLITDVFSDLSETLGLSKGYSLAVLNPRKDWMISSLKSAGLLETSLSQPEPPFYGYRHGMSNHEIEHVLHDESIISWARSLKGLEAEEADELQRKMEEELEMIAIKKGRKKGSSMPKARPKSKLPEHGPQGTDLFSPSRKKILKQMNKEDETNNKSNGATSGASASTSSAPPSAADTSADRAPASSAPTDAAAGKPPAAAAESEDRAPSGSPVVDAPGTAGAAASAAAAGSQSGPPKPKAGDRPRKILKSKLVASIRAAKAKNKDFTKTTKKAAVVGLDHREEIENSEKWAQETLSYFPYDPVHPGKSLHGVVRFMQKIDPQSLRNIALNSYTQESCLVDNWLGHGRVAFMDLSAGPFHWGPIVGGEGVRTNHTFPHLDSLAKLDIATDVDHSAASESDGSALLYYDYSEENDAALAANARILNKLEVGRGVTSGPLTSAAAKVDVLPEGALQGAGDHTIVPTTPSQRPVAPPRRTARKSKSAGGGKDSAFHSAKPLARPQRVARSATPTRQQPGGRKLNSASTASQGGRGRRGSPATKTETGSAAGAAGRKLLSLEGLFADAVSDPSKSILRERRVSGATVEVRHAGRKLLESVDDPDNYDQYLTEEEKKMMAAAINAGNRAAEGKPAPAQEFGKPVAPVDATGYSEDDLSNVLDPVDFLSTDTDPAVAKEIETLKQQVKAAKQHAEEARKRFAQAAKAHQAVVGDVSMGELEHADELATEAEDAALAQESAVEVEAPRVSSSASTANAHGAQGAQRAGDDETGDGTVPAMPAADSDVTATTVDATAAAEAIAALVGLGRRPDGTAAPPPQPSAATAATAAKAASADPFFGEEAAVAAAAAAAAATSQGSAGGDASVDGWEADDGAEAEAIVESATTDLLLDDADMAKMEEEIAFMDPEPMRPAPPASTSSASSNAGADASARTRARATASAANDDLLSDEYEIYGGAPKKDKGQKAEKKAKKKPQPGDVVPSESTDAAHSHMDAEAVHPNFEASIQQVEAEKALLQQMLESDGCVSGSIDCKHFQEELDKLDAMLNENRDYQQKHAAAKALMHGLTEENKHKDVDDDDDSDASAGKGAKSSSKGRREQGRGEVGADGKVKVDHLTFIRDDVDIEDNTNVEQGATEQLLKGDWDSEDLEAKPAGWQKPHRHRHSSDHDHSAHEMATGQSSMLEVDHFLAHLSAALSQAQRSVVAPAMADMHLMKGFNKRVVFNIYVLRNHNAFQPLENDFQSLFKIAMSQFRLEGQEFTFSFNELSMADDAALAMAYTSSLRAAVVPTLMFDGHFTSIKRLYLDSQVLEHELKARLNTRQLPQQRGTREIPIFLFSLDSTLPVFIDKHFQARALPSMVVAVQSNYRLWESTISCNNRPIYWNLRNPLKAIIASSAQLLGGLLPMQQTFDEVHRRDAQAWTWAVGDSPLSPITSHDFSIRFSQMQVDALHRNYVITAVRKATSIVNRAVLKLRTVRTTEANSLIVKELYERSTKDNRGIHIKEWRGKSQFKLARKAYRSVRYRIHRIRKFVAKLDFKTAVSKIPHLIGNAYQFSSLADTLVARARKMDCECRAQAEGEDFTSTLGQMWGTVKESLPMSFAQLASSASAAATGASSNSTSTSSSSASPSSSKFKAVPPRNYKVGGSGLGVKGWMLGAIVVIVLLLGRLCYKPKAKPKVN